MRLSLSQRLSLVFATVLVASCATSAWLQTTTSERHEQEVIQRLSAGLAAHIAGNSELMEPTGLNQKAVHTLFDKLMDVNPSVEVYLLDLDGRIIAQSAPDGHVKRDRVAIGPIQRLLAGGALPILGDDPRSAEGEKVFNAAVLKAKGSPAGYVYVVLLGEEHDALVSHVERDDVLTTALTIMGLVAMLWLGIGLLAFHWITRPLRMLTAEVHRIRASSLSQGGVPAADDIDVERGPDDEIASLQLAFHQLAKRIADQWRDLQEQDQQRRDLVANISHDLRTPLASMHGYLETLRLKAEHLSEFERLHYLDVAIDQSKKVSRLAQELFELARLEEGGVKLDMEPFSLVDLVQDVFQKFELAVEAKQQRLIPDIELDLPIVRADFGMIERVLTNLLDNALRHSPIGGEIKVKLRCDGGSVLVQVSDSGPGIPDTVRRTMFTRPSFRSDSHNFARGLGLVIVRRILLLHESDISVFPSQACGATFEFALEAANRTASARARRLPSA